ncbi:MAG: hypothetical protein AAFW84_09835 [Cyanobacteria bacterium J06635_15]
MFAKIKNFLSRANRFYLRHWLKVNATLFVVVVIAFLILIRVVPAIGNSRVSPATISPQLEGAYERISSRIEFPVLLPVEIPNVTDVDNGDYWVTPEIYDDQYFVHIERTADCNESAHCTTGSFGGELLANAESLEDLYGYIRDLASDRTDAEKWQEVSLANNITGTFIPWELTSRCADAKVFWEMPEYEARYYVSYPCGEIDDMIKFANSVIENQSSN